MSRKLALIIGNSQYQDPHLARLKAPDVDVRALAEILEAPDIGGFDEVLTLLNEGLAAVRKAIARFFDLKQRDDLLFLYFSGHGVRDEQGHLYLAVRDTERAVLSGTAIEASFVTARMDRSASKRIVVVLDCCHSEAFADVSRSAPGASVGTATAFEGTGRGRVVLTATDATQYAREGDQVIGDVENWQFTHYLIEGLRTGAADRDADGQITIDELYDYVYDKVLQETPKQTPGKWAFGQLGEIVIAKSPSLSRAKLPSDLEEALSSTLPSVRLEAISELGNVARGRHEVRAVAARDALKRLCDDDSRRVATAALDLLTALEQRMAPARSIESETGTAPQPTQEGTADQDKKRRQAASEARAARIASMVAAAVSALDRGDLDVARAPLAEALLLEPQHADALRLQFRLQRAIEERTQLQEAEQRIHALQQLLARAAQANDAGRHDEAIALLNDALALDPGRAEVNELLERYRAQAGAVYQGAAEEGRRREAKPLCLDENVQFTVYRPQVIQQASWYPLLAFAHLSEPAPDSAQYRFDPTEEVETQAQTILGAAAPDYATVVGDSRQPVPRGGELTFVPEIPGIEFNPTYSTFIWREPVHKVEFRLRAVPGAAPRRARGRLTVFLGRLILADVSLSIGVEPERRPTLASSRPAIDVARPYRQIFASYSHDDVVVAEEFARHVSATGDQYLRDVVQLRTGEKWQARLTQMIEAADLFQLFWSTNAMKSDYVHREWAHALALDRPSFVRPVYWEEPLPEPPAALQRLHFQRIYPSQSLSSPSASPALTEAVEPRTTGLVGAPPLMNSPRLGPWVWIALVLLLPLMWLVYASC